MRLRRQLVRLGRRRPILKLKTNCLLVYNQYFMSNDAVNFQQQPEYEFSGAEYEEPEEADFALEGGQGQLQIESGMDNTANSDWAYEQQQQ